jgi:hypothetical protein
MQVSNTNNVGPVNPVEPVQHTAELSGSERMDLREEARAIDEMVGKVKYKYANKFVSFKGDYVTLTFNGRYWLTKCQLVQEGSNGELIKDMTDQTLKYLKSMKKKDTQITNEIIKHVKEKYPLTQFWVQWMKEKNHRKKEKLEMLKNSKYIKGTDKRNTLTVEMNFGLTDCKITQVGETVSSKILIYGFRKAYEVLYDRLGKDYDAMSKVMSDSKLSDAAVRLAHEAEGINRQYSSNISISTVEDVNQLSPDVKQEPPMLSQQMPGSTT